MIREIFLPNSLFPQSIIGLEIGKHNILACQIQQKGKKTKIQKTVSLPIDQSVNKDHETETVNAISKILKMFSNSIIRLSVPNNKVIFKELTLPFLDTHKIKLILGYEIESSLPFPLQEAVFDFIITSQNKTKKETSILVAITQQKNIDYYTQLINKADQKININAATVDLFGMYGIYTHTSQGRKYQSLIELGKNSITISYIKNNNIKIVRNLPYGISNIVTKISNDTKIPRKEIVESLLRFGVDQHEDQVIEKHFEKLINDILFTINSFKSHKNFSGSIKNILIIESALEIKNISNYISQKIDFDCYNLDIKKISNNKNIAVSNSVNLSTVGLPSLAAAITTDQNKYFNLISNNAAQSKLIGYQVITALSITLIIFASIYGISFAKRKVWQASLDYYKKNSWQVLKNTFTGIDSRDLDLDEFITMADSKVNQEKKIWFSFSNQSRYSFLKYLQALSNAIAENNININIKKLTIADDTMTIKGSATEFKDVYDFEKALKAVPLFLHITTAQERDFTIKIVLKKSSEVRT